jgi:ABC-type transport system substrate-binding protein
MGIEQDFFVTSLYGGTLTRNASGSAAGSPGLAQSLSSQDGYRRWTVTLRTGLHFSNGAPLTSKDVVATFDRILKNKYAYELLLVPTLTSVTAAGSQTVVFKFGSPSPLLPVILSDPTLLIFPASSLSEGAAFFKHPISAGPYAIQSWSPNSVVLHANPYWSGTKGGTQTINFSVTADPGTRLSEVQSGNVNWAFDLPGTLIPQIHGNAHVQVAHQLGSVELMLNNKSAPLSDPRVRRAISLAINRSQLNQLGWNGQAIPNSGYWPSGFPYYNRAAQGQTTPNVTLAKQTLKGTACAAGCTIDMLVNASYPWASPTSLVVEQNLASIGIHLRLTTLDEATFGTRETKGQYQMLMDRWQAHMEAPEGLITINLQPSGPLAGGLTFYKSPRMDALVAQLLRTPAAQRAPIAAEINALFNQDQPYANLIDSLYINASNLSYSVIHQFLWSLIVQ